MMNSTRYKNENSFLSLIAFISLVLVLGFEGKVNAQTAPNFGTASKFVLFSGIGAVSNTGTSILKGNVGANIGAISGFETPTTIDGTIENVNAVTAQAALDLKAACVQLQNTPATITNHSTIYGNGETLVPGVYSAGAAASIIGSLILDAKGNPNALFIFKIGGALTAAANTTVILTNGALASNVIWIANGAVAMAAGTTMNGTLIGYDGAVSMGAGCILNGSLYSNVGAVSVYETKATIPPAIVSYGFLGPYTNVGQAKGLWLPLMKGDKFDPIDDQQSVADTDFVGNAANAMVETQKETISFTDGVIDDAYFFRVRMGQSNASTSFYLGVDVSGDLIADLFIEANMKSQTPYMSFHKRDYSKTGLSPSQTSWLNGTKNNEFFLDARNSNISTYTAGTDIDGGSSGADSWIEFGFTEESLKAYVLNNFGLTITGNSAIALYGFTSTSQTSNGDVAGVNDKLPGVLDKSWEELGVIINGTFNNIASGEILTPTVNSQTTTVTTPVISGTWGGEMLGDDHLTVTINGVTYSQEIYINNTNWSLTILYPEMLPGTYEVVAKTTRISNNKTSSDITTNELVIEGTTVLTTVTSANDGGLESNGDLASLIAKRNFNRIKTNSFANKKEFQKKFVPTSIFSKTTGSSTNFSAIIPNTGMLGTETTFVSSPTDLIGITNAKEVYSVDYYQGNNRVAAVLATTTVGAIYSHSKAICDRLNNSSLENIVTINLNGYEVILVQLKRANGLTEYAVNFSVEQLTAANVLHSYWNIEQYPAGDYLNFQVWGSSTAQVCHIAKAIISNMQQQKTLSAEAVDNRIPSVFVKNGFYKNGKLNLTIINKSRAFNLAFEGNRKTTELATTELVTQNVSLTGAYEQNIVLDLGGIFDIGLSIIGDKSKQLDGLYLADGPWGLDYSKTETTVSSFVIDNIPNASITNDQYAIERNASVSGSVYGTMNLFRNILPGDLVFDANGYSAIGFKIQNSLAVEVVLVTDNTTDWNDRLRFQLPANSTISDINVLFDKFTNPKGQKYNNEKIKGLVFSVQGNYNAFQPFEINVSQLVFKNAGSLSTVDFANEFAKTIYNYPNPCQLSTTLVLPKITESASVKVIDLSGKILITKEYKTIPSNNEIQVALDNLGKGIYFFIVRTKENEILQTKFMIN
jgi:hypothetical protein